MPQPQASEKPEKCCVLLLNRNSKYVPQQLSMSQMKDNCPPKLFIARLRILRQEEVSFGTTYFEPYGTFPSNTKETVIAKLKPNALNVAEPQHPFQLLSAPEDHWSRMLP